MHSLSYKFFLVLLVHCPKQFLWLLADWCCNAWGHKWDSLLNRRKAHIIWESGGGRPTNLILLSENLQSIKDCAPSWCTAVNKTTGVHGASILDQAFSWGHDHVFCIMLNNYFSFFHRWFRRMMKILFIQWTNFCWTPTVYQWTFKMLGIKYRTRQTLFCLFGVRASVWKTELEHIIICGVVSVLKK